MMTYTKYLLNMLRIPSYFGRFKYFRSKSVPYMETRQKSFETVATFFRQQKMMVPAVVRPVECCAIAVRQIAYSYYFERIFRFFFFILHCISLVLFQDL